MLAATRAVPLDNMEAVEVQRRQHVMDRLYRGARGSLPPDTLGDSCVPYNDALRYSDARICRAAIREACGTKAKRGKAGR